MASWYPWWSPNGRLPSWRPTRMQRMKPLTVDLCALALSVAVAACSPVFLSTHLAVCPKQRFLYCCPSGKGVTFRIEWSQEDPIVYSIFPSDFPHGGYFVFMESFQGHIITEANHSFGMARNTVMWVKDNIAHIPAFFSLWLLLNLPSPSSRASWVWDAPQEFLASPVKHGAFPSLSHKISFLFP